MLFGKSSGLTSGQIRFLNEVDKEYMRAFSTLTIRNLQSYLSKDCCDKVNREIHSVNQPWFASAKFRNTKWFIEQSISRDELWVRKVVSFDRIKLAGSVSMSAADDYEELWLLSQMRGHKVVKDIIRVD